MGSKESICPGCRVRLPRNFRAEYTGYYHCSAECWTLYSEVLGYEFSHVIAFSQVHQFTVDSYALQHAGGNHTPKSIAVHLVGLYAAFELDFPPRAIPGLLQSVAQATKDWPEFKPPRWTGPLSILEIAMASSEEEHIRRVRKWARFVWRAWDAYHGDVAKLARPSAKLLVGARGRAQAFR